MRPAFARSAPAAAAALIAVTMLAACGSDDGGDGAQATATTSATVSSAPPASDTPITETAEADPDRTVIEVTMTGSKVEPAPDTVDVEKGSKVRIIVTRDTDGEIHLHGFGDLSVDAEAGVPARLDFVADEQGSYEVEAHDPDRQLLTLQVR